MFNLFQQFFMREPHMDTYTAYLEEDLDGVFIDLGEAAEQLGWQVGDTLDWQVQGDCVVIKNITQNPELF